MQDKTDLILRLNEGSDLLRFVQADGHLVITENKLPAQGDFYVDYVNRSITRWDLGLPPSDRPYCDVIIFGAEGLNLAGVVSIRQFGSLFTKVQAMQSISSWLSSRMQPIDRADKSLEDWFIITFTGDIFAVVKEPKVLICFIGERPVRCALIS